MRAQALLDDDALVTFSSDVTSPAELDRANPFIGLQIGHNRQDIEGGKDAPIMQPITERLSLSDMVKGYTITGAKQLGMNQVIGSIEVGKSADFTILPQDLFSTDRFAIHKIQPDMTFMESKKVFENNWKYKLKHWAINNLM